jgi:hypothetical protein
MKSIYKEIKLKNLFYKFLFFAISITSSIIITCALIFFIAPMFKKNDIIPVNVYVFENELSTKIQDEINNAISISTENIYNRLLANIQFSIALFSAALVIFAIVFGVIYFSKIKDAENLIKEIQKTPDLFFKQFYREQFNKNISNLFSQSYITRNSAINNLSLNPEISAADYDILQEVLINELDYATHVYFYQNINTLTSILIKIDYQKTISLIMTILKEQKKDIMKHNNLLSHIIADNSEKSRSYIEEMLLKDDEMGTQLISLLLSNGALNHYMSFILEKCHGSVLRSAINWSGFSLWNIKIDNITDHILTREDIDTDSLQSIISHKTISIIEKITIVLKFYFNNTEKYDQSLKYLINNISNDENAKNDLIVISEKHGHQELLKLFFTKNNYLKSNFSNFMENNIFKEASAINDGKTASDIIKSQGLIFIKDRNVIIDKDGKEYKIEPYTLSLFTGTMLPVNYGIMLDNTFINIEDLNKNIPD